MSTPGPITEPVQPGPFPRIPGRSSRTFPSSVLGPGSPNDYLTSIRCVMMIPIIISILYTKYCINCVIMGPCRSLLSPIVEEVVGAEDAIRNKYHFLIELVDTAKYCNTNNYCGTGTFVSFCPMIYTGKR